MIFSTLFGVIYDQIFQGPMSAWLPFSGGLVLLGLLTPAVLARKTSKWHLTALALIATIARVIITLDDATVRYWSALVLLGAAGSFLALSLRHDRDRFSSALVWGLLWEYLLRVLGDTFDLSLHDGALPYVAVCGVVVILLALKLQRSEEELAGGDSGISWPLSLGLGTFFFLESSLFALPAAVARYASVSYAPVAVLLFLASAAILIPGLRQAAEAMISLRRVRVASMALVALGFLIGYFTDGWLAAGGLILAQLLAIAGIVHALRTDSPSSKKALWRFPIGMLGFLVLNFLNAFAFTYPYTLPLMREKGWLVYLVAIIVLGWSVIRPTSTEARQRTQGASLQGALVLAGLALTMIVVWPRTPLPLPQDSLRLATWNMHYGYDDAWHTNMQEMASVIAAEGVDVIALQEVDTGRMTSYSSDNAYFLARRLGMQVVYLPAVEHLTGIALLYKGPRAPSDMTNLTSLQEQTGVVHAALDWGPSGLDAYGIWMGLSDEDTLRQIDEALAYIGGASPASFGGDFNARPEDPEIDAVRATGFADPFVLLGVEQPPPTSPAVNPQSRIDFVWLRGLIPVKAWVSDSLASDHRMVVVEVSPH